VDEVAHLLSANTVQRRQARAETADDSTVQDSWVLPLVYLVGGQVIIALVALLLTKFRRNTKGHKNI
jgi:hypothetical protein